jgi:hypothetical protein
MQNELESPNPGFNYSAIYEFAEEHFDERGAAIAERMITLVDRDGPENWRDRTLWELYRASV